MPMANRGSPVLYNERGMDHAEVDIIGRPFLDGWSYVYLAHAQVRGSVSVNVDPAPSTLSTVMSPPMTRANSRLIASPNPTPSLGRVSEGSIWTKGSKMAASLS